jgi:hypothetical protein
MMYDLHFLALEVAYNLVFSSSFRLVAVSVYTNIHVGDMVNLLPNKVNPDIFAFYFTFFGKQPNLRN